MRLAAFKFHVKHEQFLSVSFKAFGKGKSIRGTGCESGTDINWFSQGHMLTQQQSRQHTARPCGALFQEAKPSSNLSDLQRYAFCKHKTRKRLNAAARLVWDVCAHRDGKSRANNVRALTCGCYCAGNQARQSTLLAGSTGAALVFAGHAAGHRTAGRARLTLPDTGWSAAYPADRLETLVNPHLPEQHCIQLAKSYS